MSSHGDQAVSSAVDLSSSSCQLAVCCISGSTRPHAVYCNGNLRDIGRETLGRVSKEGLQMYRHYGRMFRPRRRRIWRRHWRPWPLFWGGGCGCLPLLVMVVMFILFGCVMTMCSTPYYGYW